MNKINKIYKMMAEAGLESVDFFFHKNKPTVQRKGIKYEILSIYTDEDENRIRLSAIPCYSWGLAELYMDESWNKKTIDKVTQLVREQTYKLRYL